MNKRVAILYDFDFTLASNYMQSFGLMQDLGFDDIYKYFGELERLGNCKDMDMCLANLCGLREITKSQGKKLTKEYMQSFGKNIEYYPGVLEWFDKINAIGASLGYDIEHYIISSGQKEIIEGSVIAKHFKRIYANFYSYKDDVAFWPSQIVNYTSKTQYVFRVRKNVLDDLSSLDKINRKMPNDEVLPFKNIIYLGDSETDIPSFKVVKNSGGLSICVYEKGSEKAKATAQKCFIDGRVNFFTPADYREGSTLFNLIKDYIGSIDTIGS